MSDPTKRLRELQGSPTSGGGRQGGSGVSQNTSLDHFQGVESVHKTPAGLWTVEGPLWAVTYETRAEAIDAAQEITGGSLDESKVEGGLPNIVATPLENAPGGTPNFEGSLPGPGGNKSPMDRLKDLQGSPTSGGSKTINPSGNAATPGVDAPDVPDIPSGSSGGAARTIVLTILGILAAFAWGSR